jgi:hypothetical protein
MEPNYKGIIDAALEIASRRRDTVSRLREALIRGDEQKALEIARELCGVGNEQKRDRIDSRFN